LAIYLIPKTIKKGLLIIIMRTFNIEIDTSCNFSLINAKLTKRNLLVIAKPTKRY